MQKTNFKKKFCILLFSVVLMSLLAVTSLAAVTYENGTLSGLLPGTEYQYTYVTLENYNISLEQIDVSGNEFTTITADKYGKNDTVTDAGIIYLVNANNAADVNFVWIEGDALSRSDIGKRKDNGTLVAQGVEMGGAYDWTEGTWMMYTYGTTLHQPSANNISNGSGGHFTRTYCTTIYENPDDTELQAKVKADIESVKYKYAYQPSEIIPVEELYTFSYNTGLREGSINARSASGQAILTKVVLYTLNETGMITAHAWTEPTTYFTGSGGNIASNAKTTHTISVPASFPDATGYVMGIEVYPYAVLPDDVKFTVNGYWHTKEQGSLYTSYLFEYIPDGYTTVYKHYETKIPAQYNGANTAYIEGYANGTFNPDGNITKAEAATIIARLIFGEKDIPVGYVSKFDDVTANAWYYNTIAYLEAQGVFDYIEGSELEPNAVLTRGELAQMVSAFIELPLAKNAVTFPDVTESTKYADAIIAIASAGIVKGDDEGNFNPEANITRAEAVTLFNRLINLTVNDETVVASTLENTFSDIPDDKWYTNNILVAANDKVKTQAHINANSALKSDGDSIVITTDKFSVKINKANARIAEIVANNTNFVSTTLSPYFATLTSTSGLVYTPKSADVVDGRLQIVFGNGIEAYFIVEANDNFFTVQLDSELPFGVASVKFASLSVNANTEEYRLSAIVMDTRVTNSYNPGGMSKATAGNVSGTLDSVLGAKIGVTFASYDAHRDALKNITNAIDITKGIKSDVGGAYIFDDKSGLAYKDTAIIQNTKTDTLQSYIDTAKAYSVDVLQVHQAADTYRQGDFDFSYSLGTSADALIQEHETSAKAYKAVVSDTVHKAGLYLNMHTYSSGLKADALTALLKAKPEANYLDQIYYNPAQYTLAGDIGTTDQNLGIKVNGGTGTTADLNYPNKNAGSSDATAVPYSTFYTAYFRIDDEIVSIAWDGDPVIDENTIKVYRGRLGTTAVAHSEGAEIKQILGIHQCIQPVAGSELFYEVARRTAQAYVEAGFDMIYLDGQEGFTTFLVDQENKDYYRAEFVRVILEEISNLNEKIENEEDKARTPIIESSAFSTNNMWVAGGKYGAVDSAVRGIKTHKKAHFRDNCQNNENYYYTSTLGWFKFNPDGSDTYKNTINHTLFRDDLDYMGSLAIAYDIGMSLNSMPEEYDESSKTTVNLNYYGVYSRLRKAGYFSDAVKETIRNGEYEYRLVEEDGAYAFQEMYYDKNRVYDEDYATGTATNPFEAAVPFIRIEQNYTAGSENTTPLVDVGDAQIQVANADYTTLGVASKDMALKVNVTGNEKNGAILISLYDTTTPNSNGNSGHADYLISTNHLGSKEFTLVETDNGDYNGFSFDGIGTGLTNWGTHGAGIDLSKVKLVRVRVAGDVEGVTMGDIRVANIASTSATNPTITINGSTIKFVTSDRYGEKNINSGDYVEYYPETNKAYLHYYTDGVYAAKELTVEGSVTAPNGEFEYTYSATGTVKAKVVIGMQGEKIANDVNPSLPDMGTAKLGVPVSE